MDLAHSRTLSNEILNKNPYLVPEQAYLIILVKKPYIYMANNGKGEKTDTFPEEFTL